MSFPSDQQLTNWATTLQRTDWHDLTRRLSQAIQRDKRGGHAIPDGYPTTTRGGNGGTAELTSVEAAVEARLRGAHDEHHQLTRNACWRFEDILTALATTVTMLNRMDTRAIPTDTTIDDWCSNHLRHGQGLEPRYRGDLCQWCYRFQLVEKFLPTADLLDKHEHGGVYDRDITQARNQRNGNGRRVS